jgi:hypothetical protein
MSQLDPVRATIAAEHGLTDEAARFLTGDTIEAIEASAVSLTKLLGERAEKEATVSKATDPISASLASKAQRQAALVQALHGQPAQARDERGRFTSAAGGFDGGAREAIPEKGDPAKEHDELISDMARVSATFGRSF